MFYSMIGLYATMHYNIMSDNLDNEGEESSVWASNSMSENNIIPFNNMSGEWHGTNPMDIYK